MFKPPPGLLPLSPQRLRICSVAKKNSSRKLSEKGLEQPLEPPFLAPQSSEIELLTLFRGPLRLQIGAYRGFRTVSLGSSVNRDACLTATQTTGTNQTK